MDVYEIAIRQVYDAIDEINYSGVSMSPIEKSPETLLLGGDGALDSLGLVTLIAAIEENTERTFKQSISVMDVVLLEGGDLAVGMLATRIVEILGDGERGHHSASPLPTQTVEGHHD